MFTVQVGRLGSGRASRIGAAASGTRRSRIEHQWLLHLSPPVTWWTNRLEMLGLGAIVGAAAYCAGTFVSGLLQENG
jgi:hypothetical protein